ncbi:type II toxin-antitoxin system RelE/ParE family toxin [Pseudoroseomonas sp. WGS1072]|uniref:type II toxin-antitoxin system RelE/ParE family toxin n=1 Tax=Roseomonas sp. WGS1072 TaxID=3366816 RepID=UPI003BF114FC
MIVSFLDRTTEAVFHRQRVKAVHPELARAVLRKLLIIAAATDLNDLRVPPGNRLEALSGNRAGQHSIRVNDQWRICFEWRDGAAHDVELTDYH